MNETQADAYSRRPAESRHLTLDQYAERAPLGPEHAVGVLIDGVCVPFTGRRYPRSDRFGTRWVEADACLRDASGHRIMRARVTQWVEPNDGHSPRRAGVMLVYPRTLSDIEGPRALRWRAA